MSRGLRVYALGWSMVLGAATATTQAADVGRFGTAVREGEAALSGRYRYEHVDQDGFDEHAAASTALVRLSWNSAPVESFHLGLEADYVGVIGDERYDSTENGRGRYPVVADPQGFDLNQAFLAYTTEDVAAVGGRQRINHASQRFVGGVGWRQNEQTYDAVSARFDVADRVTLDYSYVWNVNRVFGPDDGAQPGDWRSDSHFAYGATRLGEHHTLGLFGYLMDFDNDNGPVNANASYGIDYQGVFGPLTLAASLARQTDWADSPLDYRADYYFVEGALALEPVTLTAGYEVLGSDGGAAAFRTPLATLHKFQGWADTFLNTPPDGVRDRYAGVAGAVGQLTLGATWHDFTADEGDADYGTELDLVAAYPVHPNLTVQLKYARYAADTFGSDTTKAWLTFDWKL